MCRWEEQRNRRSGLTFYRYNTTLPWFTLCGEITALTSTFSEMGNSNNDNTNTLLSRDCKGRPSAKVVFEDLRMKNIIVIQTHMLLLAAKLRTTLANDPL